MNQDHALRLWRQDSARDDPAPYTVREMLGATAVWLSVAGNVGWFFPRIVGGELVGIRSIALPRAHPGETEEDRRVLDYVLRSLSPKVRRKIVHLVSPGTP